MYPEENLDAHPLGLEAAALDARKKILIVDDSATARTIYKNKLALMGFVIREASGGTEAIKALGKERLDLIILDMQMEDMDGVKLLQLLRTNEEWKQIKVIVLSGRLTPQDAERVSAFSVSDILPKMTTTPNKLAERAKQILKV
ncbi:MAG: response regulator [Deltaproteobacteria bacterium]|nr:response regulator [Deltaproteobacteria bacterium]